MLATTSRIAGGHADDARPEQRRHPADPEADELDAVDRCPRRGAHRRSERDEPDARRHGRDDREKRPLGHRSPTMPPIASPPAPAAPAAKRMPLIAACGTLARPTAPGTMYAWSVMYPVRSSVPDARSTRTSAVERSRRRRATVLAPFQEARGAAIHRPPRRAAARPPRLARGRSARSKGSQVQILSARPKSPGNSRVSGTLKVRRLDQVIENVIKNPSPPPPRGTTVR